MSDRQINKTKMQKDSFTPFRKKTPKCQLKFDSINIMYLLLSVDSFQQTLWVCCDLFWKLSNSATE